jgi:hypothetical protein
MGGPRGRIIRQHEHPGRARAADRVGELLAPGDEFLGFRRHGKVVLLDVLDFFGLAFAGRSVEQAADIDGHVGVVLGGLLPRRLA